jgi:hypothetical protein
VNAIQRAEEELAKAKQKEADRQAYIAQEAINVEIRREQRRAEEAYRAKRPERWAALSPLERALFWTAAEEPRSIRAALLRVAQLVGSPNGYPVNQPASTFEPKEPL